MTNQPTYFCRMILHDGDGPPDTEQKITSITGFSDHGDAAEYFTSMFVDKEMRSQGISEEDIGCFDGDSFVVEVRHPEFQDWQRFRVGCKVKLEFSAQAERCPKCGWQLHADAKDGCIPGNCSQRKR